MITLREKQTSDQLVHELVLAYGIRGARLYLIVVIN